MWVWQALRQENKAGRNVWEFGLHFVDSFESWKFFKQNNLKYLLLELGGQTIRDKYRAFGASEIIYWSAQKSMVKNLRTWIQ